MASPQRLGLAGFGAWGRLHARALGTIDDARLATIFCHSDAAAAAAKEMHPDAYILRSWPDLLAADIDVIDITVPNDLHARFAIDALNGGKNVLLEKPLGLTRAECADVIAAARRNNRQVAVNHELRVSHQWGKVRQMLASGTHGRIRHQHFSLFRHPFRPGSGGWRRDQRRVGSWILEELVHFVDLIFWYARENGPPARVTAFGSAGLADTISAHFQWPDGSTALVTQCLAGFQHHTLLEVACTDGAIRTWWSGAFDRTEKPAFELTAASPPDHVVKTIPIEQSGEIFELRESLAKALAGFRGGPPVIPLEEASHAVVACLAIEESLTKGTVAL